MQGGQKHDEAQQALSLPLREALAIPSGTGSRQLWSSCKSAGVTENPWIIFQATLMTSHPIAAYGGVEFPREALEMGASKLNGGDVPMQVDHDQTKPVRVRGLRAWVEDDEDGFCHLKISYEVHPDDVHRIGNRRAMSVGIRAPLDGRDSAGSATAAINLSADHAWFNDDALIAAEAVAVEGGLSTSDIRTERVYQFSFVPDPQIFVTVALPIAGAVATGILSSALWDAVKTLFKKRQTPPNGDEEQPTRVNLHLKDGERSLTGVIETGDESVANRAIDAFEELARQFMDAPASPVPHDQVGHRRLLLWDEDAGAWSPHSPQQDVQTPRSNGDPKV